MIDNLPLVLRFAGIWIIYCAWAVASGWILSYFQLLSPVHYACSGVFLIGSSSWWWIKTRPCNPCPKSLWSNIRKKNKNTARAAWITVAILIGVAAALHPPTNHDALTYRMPRLYYWLQEHGWHWIGGLDYRMDIAGTGFEWMSIPFILISGNDRLLFLLNFIPFLLLPGLSFLAGRGVGLNNREARWWMWTWPLAYGVAMQAGSIGNDFLGVAFSLSALAFARAAGRWNPSICLGFSATSIILLTGVKITTLPLSLPLAIYWVYQAWKHLSPRKMLIIPSFLFPAMLLCGLLPISFLCWKHTGKWNGNPDNRLGSEANNPLAGIVGNGLNMFTATVYPPVFPRAGPIGRHITNWLDSKKWHDWVRSGNSSYSINLNQELPSEELAGIGIGVTLLMVFWIFGAFKQQQSNQLLQRPLISKFYIATTTIALTVFLAKVSSGTTARLALPFTPHLVFSCVLLFRPRMIMPHRSISILPAIFLLPSLLLNPNRPLISPTLLNSIPFLPSAITERMNVVYATYSNRNRLLAPISDLIPNGNTAAFAGGTDHPASALFYPLHRIHVIDLNRSNIGQTEWVVGTEEGIHQRLSLSLDEFQQQGFKMVIRKSITDKVIIGPEEWYLFHKDP